jgi:hypothetical protein
MYKKENIESDFSERSKSNPFRTPEGYFDTVEDRIMGAITHSEKPKHNSPQIIRFLKPALTLAASLAMVYFMVYFPVNYLKTKSTAQTEVTDSANSDIFDAYSLSFSLIDDNTLVNTIYSEDANPNSNINSDDMLAYISSGMNDIEIYSEIQN